MWMAQGYLGVAATSEVDLECIGDEYFASLTALCIFQDVQNDGKKVDSGVTCKMHDLVHDFAEFVSEREVGSIDGRGEMRSLGRTFFHLQIETSGQGILPNLVSDLKGLRTIFATENPHLSGRDKVLMVNLPTCLRSLSLTRCNLSVLPPVISQLILLRLLDLSHNRMKELPDELCELVNLQTLDLEGCGYLEKWPQGMEKLVNLRHLINLRAGWSFPKGIGGLTGLRTLSEMYLEESVSLVDLHNLNQLSGSLVISNLGTSSNHVEEAKHTKLEVKNNITKLSLGFNHGSKGFPREENWLEEEEISKKMLEALKPSENLEELEVEGYWGKVYPSWLPLLSNLTRLTLSLFRCLEVHLLGKLPCLEYLQLSGFDWVTAFDSREFFGRSSSSPSSPCMVAFPRLEVLKISYFKNLKEWQYEGDKNIYVKMFMPCIRTLYFEECDNLVKLPDQLLQKATLEKLKVRHCYGLHLMYDTGGKEQGKVAHIPNVFFDNVACDCGNVVPTESPLNDTSGRLALDSNGYLNLHAANITSPIWSAKFPNLTNSVAQILDSGNLVVVQDRTGTVLWQSFDYPTDTLLPYMKLGFDRRTGLNRSVTSWKSETDPGIGSVNYRIDPTGYPQLFLYKNHSVPTWRGGPWTGLRWSGVLEMSKNYIFNVSYVNDKNEVSILYGITNASILSRMYVEESGVVKRATWNGHGWIEFWSAPKEQCDNYGTCGPNSNCDPSKPDTFYCKCLPGFEPKSGRDWYLRDGSGGCVRKAGGKSTCRSGEGFVKVARVKVPDTSVARVEMGMGLKECEEECLKNCTCEAYTSADERGIGCLRWYGELVDTRSYSGGGQDIYVRVDADVLATYNKPKGLLHNAGMQALLIISVAVTLFLAIFLAFCLIRRNKKARDRVDKLSFYFETTNPDNSVSQNNSRHGNADLPFFHLSEIAAATNNFSDDNKLGEGGFGSVYKGTYKGNEIAVKRLSKHSGQGGEEFKNEVELIAKLQHRNLVRILGCCVEGHEKMLVYEYLPNKSLDYFIFDEDKKALLDWPTRYNIICGIARGILYLHEDSRLRIIHRDLKASNVLLDVSMNPKISDFGMARIFGTGQIEANTNRVVGTYGYMSPEYAMQGMFSVKSDVYSFGVLLLETVAGRKNSSYYEEATSSSLVGYLWKEDKALEIVDLSLGDSYPKEDVLRCIQIGLLCVQELSTDRPNMFDVVFMLCNIETTPPTPKKPAFILKRSYYSGETLTGTTTDGANSVNDVTVTMLEAR
ncbi:G-type lectin S-receptor-like serine/threonine-protein kinase RKS1 [Linum perenne]